MACLSLAAAVQKAAKHGGEDRAPKTAVKLPLPLAAALNKCLALSPGQSSQAEEKVSQGRCTASADS